ncbi:class I SAM-dependent methyltransferase [Cephaloticoccus primus]|uniref:class I SAM-dependent methyltransferase n=1 Tax=Cephaloticoccus primus TaxID=1548207 RepID=UPI0034E0C0B8
MIESLRDSKYEVIFVDGDHSEAGARHDFKTYGPKVVPGGWLVADDAGFGLPGNDHLPKGYKEVAAALEELEPLGFENSLNVWHNRVFQKL